MHCWKITNPRRQNAQESSLLAHMDKLKFLDPDNVFVEFGCGKGKLSHLVQQVVGGKKHILVDRQRCFRNKADRFQQDKDLFVRIGVDIRDLNLSGIEALQQKPMVAFSKHLCGQAADLTLRCIFNTLKVQQSADTSGCKGIIIANCCHHKCAWAPYINQEFFTKQLQFTEEEFKILCSMSSWAIDGNQQQQEPATKKLKEEENLNANELTPKRRREIGFMTKRLIDYGRILFLQEHGYDAYMMYFVDEETTPENCLLIALPKQIDVPKVQ